MHWAYLLYSAIGLGAGRFMNGWARLSAVRLCPPEKLPELMEAMAFRPTLRISLPRRHGATAELKSSDDEIRAA